MSKNLLLLFLVLVTSCASTQEEKYRVEILLTPKFPVTLGLGSSKHLQSQLLDNDGNIYISYWDAPDASFEKFSQHVTECKETIKDQRLFLSSYTIHDYNINNIKPSLYRPFTYCIIKKGYMLQKSEAFSPDYFELSFSRSHSTEDNYMPVGSQYKIENRKARYINVYRDTMECDAKIVSSGNGVDETNSHWYSRVSIEKYVNEFRICLEMKSYIVKTNN